MIQLLREDRISWGFIPGHTDNNVYFIENNKNKKLTKYIKDHFDEISIKFAQKGLTFIYVNELVALSNEDKLNQEIRRLFPDLDINGNEYKNIFQACRMEIQELRSLSRRNPELPPFISNTTERAYQIELDNPDLYGDLFYQLADAYGTNQSVELSTYSQILLNMGLRPLPCHIWPIIEGTIIRYLFLQEIGKRFEFEDICMALYILLLREALISGNRGGIRDKDLVDHAGELEHIMQSITFGQVRPQQAIDNIVNGSTLSSKISKINGIIRNVLIGPGLYEFYTIKKSKLHDGSNILKIDLPAEYIDPVFARF